MPLNPHELLILFVKLALIFVLAFMGRPTVSGSVRGFQEMNVMVFSNKIKRQQDFFGKARALDRTHASYLPVFLPFLPFVKPCPRQSVLFYGKMLYNDNGRGKEG